MAVMGMGSPWKRFRNRLRRHAFLVRTKARLRGGADVMVDPGRTQLCIEGYPRSANSTTYRMFMLGNPDVHVGHHTHAIANVALAVRNGIPTLILIRRPLDAVCSALVASRRGDVEDELLRYVSFYEWVERHASGVVLAEFEAVLADWNRAIDRVNRRFGTSFATHPDLAVALTKTKEWIHNRYARARAGMDVTNMPLPSAQRGPRKEKWKSAVLAHPLYPQAEAVYHRLRPLWEEEA